VRDELVRIARLGDEERAASPVGGSSEAVADVNCRKDDDGVSLGSRSSERFVLRIEGVTEADPRRDIEVRGKRDAVPGVHPDSEFLATHGKVGSLPARQQPGNAPVDSDEESLLLRKREQLHLDAVPTERQIEAVLAVNEFGYGKGEVAKVDAEVAVTDPGVEENPERA